MTPSKYQIVIYRAVSSENGNIVVEATAGSGKTTTIVQCAKLITPQKRTIFLAFNKSIVTELRERLPKNVECATLHSLGMTALYKYYGPKLNVNTFKTFIHAEKYLKKMEKDLDEEDRLPAKDRMIYKFNVVAIIDLMRMTMAPRDIPTVTMLCDRYDIYCEHTEIKDSLEIMEALDTYNRQRGEKKDIDFVDMIYLPHMLGIKMPQYDVVFLDEAQDLNAAQHKLVEAIIRPNGGRLIAVGDPCQAIYSFAGADSESFNKLIQIPNTTVLPLSVSYRCGKNIVEHAREVFTAIEPFENNHEGRVVNDGDVNDIEDGDFVLCRNTRPLVALYFYLVSQGKKCHILGKDIEKNLLNMVSKLEGMDKEQAMAKLMSNLKEIAMELSQKGVKKPKEHERFLNYFEKVKVIEMIFEKYNYIWEVENALTEIFHESKEGVKLMTIHKSKGLECKRIFVIRQDLLPSKYAHQDWQLLQELNLDFVLRTRAINELHYVSNWSDETGLISRRGNKIKVLNN